jgi:hypothetical protein
VRIEDQFGNLRTTDNGTVITASRGTGTGTLQGTLTAASVNGIARFNNLSYNVAETINLALASAGLNSTNSGSIVVSPAAASRLTTLTQPSATATAGVPFAQQPVIRVEDQFGNLRSSDNSTVITATRAAGAGTLQGTATATASGGIASFGCSGFRSATD